MTIEIPKNYYRISVKALVFDDTRKKFLLIQNDDGVYDLPGGGLVWGESWEECLRREVQEEMGLKITSISKDVECFFTVVNDAVKYAYVIHEITFADLNFIPSDECRSILFVSPEEVNDLKVRPNIAVFLKEFKK